MAGTEQQQSKSVFADMKKYVNLKKLCLNLGNLLMDDDESSHAANNDDDDDNDNDRAALEPKEVLKAFIETVKIGEFPITVKVTRNGVQRAVKKQIKDLFDPKKLKDFLTKMGSHAIQGKIAAVHFHKYIRLLRKSLRADRLQEVLGVEDFVNLDGALLAAENYYKNVADRGIVEDFINLDRVPGFLGDILREYFDLGNLSIVLNTALRREEVEQSMILATLNFKPLIEQAGCAPQQVQDLEGGLRGLASVAITAVKKGERAAFHTLFRYLALGYEHEVFGSLIRRR